MSLILSTYRPSSGLYSFGVDGGAVGTINLGVYFKPKTKITMWGITVPVACTSGGSATVSIGATGLATTTFFNAVAVGTLVLNYSTAVATGAIVIPSSGSQLTLTIGTAALTAGQIIFWANTLEMEV